MTAEHDAVRARLGPVGVWSFAFDSLPADAVRQTAREIESLGYPSLWVPEGGGSREIFAHLSLLLSATERITVCSGIANVTARHAEAMSGGARTLADAFGERVVLGLGIGHQVTTGRRGQDWGDPVGRMAAYLDAMDAAQMGPLPEIPPRRLLAALGPRMLRLAGERALGAHTYFVPVEHTARARAELGPEPVLAVEQTAVATSDPSRARRIARGWAASYLELPNYANNWRRLGFGEDDVAGSDRLLDAGIVWGDADTIAGRIREHLDAGADHVGVQVISSRDDDACVPQLTELAALLLER
ncbi:MAG TPA: TIGR03620 family F420-dependent LLM class oxidoreductase [Actinomycetota bacterium]|nr:TIGR03620 family F420-dependent LLM class oxidoreductase [Actinomycetota bacterium]